MRGLYVLSVRDEFSRFKPIDAPDVLSEDACCNEIGHCAKGPLPIGVNPDVELLTWSFVFGPVVPMPTLPLLFKILIVSDQPPPFLKNLKS